MEIHGIVKEDFSWEPSDESIGTPELGADSLSAMDGSLWTGRSEEFGDEFGDT